MAKRCKGLNSMCFLFSYLMIVGFLLVLWMNRLPLINDDQRAIPTELEDYLESPPRYLPSFSMTTKGKLALTNEWLEDKWTFVYFSHSHCMPDCRIPLDTMKLLKSAFASADFEFLLIGFDVEHEAADKLAEFLQASAYDFTAASAATIDDVDNLARTFRALFLQTDFTDGSYQLEQEHNIFLVDPKGRVYATFRRPYSAENIKKQFLKARRFYAKTE